MSTTVNIIEGTVPFTYANETYQTWYKVFGDLSTAIEPPLIVVHGGPGLSHDYLLACADLATSTRPVVFYDQLGNAHSTHLPDKDPSFWTIPLFLAELENLISQLKIDASPYDLLGHSWGGVLAAELAVREPAPPAGLRKVVLANSLPSIALWGQSVGMLLSKFPEDVQEGMKGGLKADPEKFRKAAKTFFAVHGCTAQPPPPEFLVAMEYILGERGPRPVADAEILGKANWTVIDRLHRVSAPTLVLNGAADMAQDFVVQPLVDGISGAKHAKFEQSSHMPFWEERELFMKVVGDFLVE
ncbi:proline iminopeptidase [Amylostereum chailletii]|nr:proline iminopeptidase [Amylostereum chailletii]